MKSLTSRSLLFHGLSRWITIAAFFIIIFSSCKGTKETATGDNGKTPKKTFSGKILESVTIEKMAINHVPMYGPDGEKWDSWAIGKEEPDLFAQLKFRDQELFRSETRSDIAYGVAVELEENLPVTLSSWNLEHVLYIFDEDGVSDNDNIGYFSFIPFDYEKKDEIVLSSSDGQLRVTLRVRWNYIDK
jgi:hypothetical protein